jgi:hypothetical protein
MTQTSVPRACGAEPTDPHLPKLTDAQIVMLRLVTSGQYFDIVNPPDCGQAELARCLQYLRDMVITTALPAGESAISVDARRMTWLRDIRELLLLESLPDWLTVAIMHLMMQLQFPISSFSSLIETKYHFQQLDEVFDLIGLFATNGTVFLQAFLDHHDLRKLVMENRSFQIYSRLAAILWARSPQGVMLK